MKLQDFMAHLENQTSVTLVGPLLGAAHRPAGPTIYVDGGANFRPAGPLPFPAISLGDGDSGGPLDETLPAEKDYSDLAFVLRELPRHVDRLNLFGFLGGRRDHELANLGEVHQFLRRRSQARADFLDGALAVIGFSGVLELDFRGVFSLMVFETTAVTLQGLCKYKLDGSVPLEPASSHGLSNEGAGPITVQSLKPAFIFLNGAV